MRVWLATVALVACADLVGIGPIPDAATTGDVGMPDAPPPEGGAGPCTNAVTVTTASTPMSKLRVASGYVYAGLGSPTGAYSAIVRCPVTGCPMPTFVAQPPSMFVVDDYDVGAALFYTVSNATDSSMSAVHRAGLDGTNDMIVGSPSYATWVATPGDRVYWVQDSMGVTPATVHCAGCGDAGAGAVWISNLNQTAALLSDAAWVYVLAYDTPMDNTFGVYGCPSVAACGASPHTFMTGLDPMTDAPRLAADALALFVARPDVTQVVRIDLVGQTVVYKAPATAVAVDRATKDLFYIDPSGIYRGKTDGSQSASLLSSCDAAVTPQELAFDATYVYVLVSIPANSTSTVFAVHR